MSAPRPSEYAEFLSADQIGTIFEANKALTRAKALACPHPEWIFDSGFGTQGPTCGECGRPLTVVSDIQIKEMKK